MKDEPYILHGTLTPAYGRDYKTGKAALAAWNAGKDFRINCPQGSTYCSVRDTTTYPAGHKLQLRWGRVQMGWTEVAVITRQADGTYKGNFEV